MRCVVILAMEPLPFWLLSRVELAWCEHVSYDPDLGGIVLCRLEVDEIRVRQRGGGGVRDVQRGRPAAWWGWWVHHRLCKKTCRDMTGWLPIGAFLMRSWHSSRRVKRHVTFQRKTDHHEQQSCSGPWPWVHWFTKFLTSSEAVRNLLMNEWWMMSGRRMNRGHDASKGGPRRI